MISAVCQLFTLHQIYGTINVITTFSDGMFLYFVRRRYKMMDFAIGFVLLLNIATFIAMVIFAIVYKHRQGTEERVFRDLAQLFATVTSFTLVPLMWFAWHSEELTIFFAIQSIFNFISATKDICDGMHR